MSSRDWSAFDWQGASITQGDLIPGDPYQVAALGKRFRATADAINQQAANLRNLVNGQGWDSDSGRAFAKQVGDTADLLQKAFGRYNEAADALGTNVRPSGPHDEVSWRSGTEWASTLELAQVKAQDALNRGRAADADSQAAARQLHTAQGNALPNPLLGQGAPPLPGSKPDPFNTPGASGTTPAEQKAQGDKAAADGLVQQAGGDIDHAIDIRDGEGKAVAAAINDFIGSDGLKNPTHHWWDVDWRSLVADIGHIAGAIAGVAGILALCLSWVPIVGEVLGAIALVAGAVALVCDTISALDGKGNWFDVAIDVVGLLSCGAGRAIGESAKAARGVELFNEARLGGKGISEALKISDMGAKDIMDLRTGATSLFKIGAKNFGKGLTYGPFSDLAGKISDVRAAGKLGLSAPDITSWGPNLAKGAHWHFHLIGWGNAAFPLALGLGNMQLPDNFQKWEPGFMGVNLFKSHNFLDSNNGWNWSPLAAKS